MCVHMCLCQRNGEGIAACMCRSVCLWQQEKLEVFSSLLLNLWKGRAEVIKEKKEKVTGIVRRKSVSLHWEPVSGNASWPKLAGSCPSKWQQLLAVRESMSQSEEKSDGIYINTTLMAHLALRRVPGCATDS